MATDPDAVSSTPAAGQPSAATGAPDARPPHQAQALLEMVAVRAPQYGSGAQEDSPPRYNQVMGVEPPLYSEAVATPPSAGLQSPIHLYLTDPVHLHLTDPVHLQPPATRSSFDRIFGTLFKALGQCNIVLLTVLCLAVFVIVTLALETPPSGQLPRQTPPKPAPPQPAPPQPAPPPPQPVRASSFTFLRNNQTHMVRAEMRDCDADGLPIKINHFSWNPIAVHLGGSASLDLSASVSEDLRDPIKVDVKVVKHVAFIWLKVPCVGGFGSCEYDDVCSLFPPVPSDQACSEVLPHANLPCRCPVLQGHYYINNDLVQLPDVNVIPPWLKNGRYSARITAYTPATGRQLGCYKLDLTVD